jgi:aspartate dehydrogenase
MLKVGVVGVGTIGGEICRAIDGGLVRASLVGVSDVDFARAEGLARSLNRPLPILPLTDLIEASELVVEAASKAAAPVIIRSALERSRDVLVMSVGGLLGSAADLLDLATRQGRKLYVPSGAIAGLDAIKGAMVGRISKVMLTTRKPPQGLEGAPYVVEKGIDLKALKEPTIIFSGSAREAVPAFPANINVAAALSLAGIGADKTEVRIVADPTCDKNIHEIEAEGKFGKLFARMENVPSPHNPKTSYMAALSAIALLRRITASLVVGT